MKYALALLIMTTPAAADDVCRMMAEIAYKGAQDGLTAENIIDGLDEINTAYMPRGEDQTRAVVASYLAGFASGLVYSEPAEVAADYYTGCSSEGV